MKSPIWYASFDSVAGRIYTAMGERGITDLSFSTDREAFLRKIEVSRKTRPSLNAGRLSPVLERLEAYFRGGAVDFDFPLDPMGTDFEKSVWEVLRKIPWGSASTYGEVASACGTPRAARAVGGACGKNPIALIIPCHRVLRSGGDIGGYTGGLDIKKALLGIEGVITGELHLRR